MFVVIEDGSRQYTIQEGDTLTIDYRATAKAAVEAEVVNPEFKGEKLEIQKFRRRKNSRRHTGHRQKYTTVLIKSINVPGLEIVESAAAEETEPATAEG